jgi:two-component system sensor histidine kinase KdpD
LSLLIWAFYFIPVVGAPEFEDFTIILLFLFTAGIVGNLAQRLQTSELLLQAHEEKTQAVYDIIKEIATAKSSAELMKAIQSRLGRILQGTCEIVLANVDGELLFNAGSVLLKEEKERAVALWVYKNGKAAGWSTDTLPLVKNLYIPMKGFKDVIGVIVYQPKYGRKLSMDEINLLHTIAQHLANYLWRTLMEEKALKTEYMSKIEKIHYAILKSLSFQLPTALSFPEMKELREALPVLPLANRGKTLQKEPSENLQKMVENLLTMTKISTGFFSVSKTPENVYDLMEACLNNLQHFLSHHKIELDISQGLPPVMMDFSLMELMLCNILIHAAENSPAGSTIRVVVRPGQKYISFKIQDQSPPLSEKALSLLFEKFSNVPSVKFPATGLGLAIAKNIAELHEGSIEAQNRAQGGLEITVEIPIA